MNAPGRPQIHVAAGVLQRGDGRVLVARRATDSHAGGAWEFPGGKLEPGESARAGLARELAEEIGIRVLAVEALVDYSHAYPDRDVRLSVFRVTSWDGEPASLEGQPLQWAAVDQLLEIGLLPADAPIVAALGRVSRA